MLFMIFQKRKNICVYTHVHTHTCFRVLFSYLLFTHNDCPEITRADALLSLGEAKVFTHEAPNSDLGTKQ